MQISIVNHGTVVQFVPRDDEAKTWLRETGAEDWQFLGNTLVMDWRIAREFIASTSKIVKYD